MLDWAQLTLLLYIVVRMSGFVLFNPLFGRKEIPGIVQSGLILVLAVPVYSITKQTVSMPNNLPELVIRLVMELALGFLIGLVLHFFFSIPALAGEVIDTQMGMSMAKTYDAGAHASISVTARLISVLMILLFFAANGHHTLLRILLSSGEVVPFGSVSLGSNLSEKMVELFIECFLLSVKLALPVLAAELMGQAGMGILMKAIPQINVFAINIELKVMIGLILILFMIAPFSDFLLNVEVQMLAELKTILALSH